MNSFDSQRMVVLKGITEDEERHALAQHEQERQAVWSEPALLLIAPDHVWQVPIQRRQGRQRLFINRNAKTFQSYEAAKFINEEMNRFRYRNGITRVRKFVRERFWAIAKARFPDAEETIVWDHIRMNRKRI
jgi:hypothetical protein